MRHSASYIAVDSAYTNEESRSVRFREVSAGCLLAISALACGSNSDAAEADAAAAAHDATPSPDAEVPSPPDSLQHWITGSSADAIVTPTGPALFLAGGGSDQDAGFAWAQQMAPAGDVVILRTSGADGYNDYIFSDIGGFDSVETLMVDTRSLADDPYVAFAIEHAEVIFMAGGDQWTYLDNWRGTKVQAALAGAWERGAVIGGTSAGCAVLGEFAFSAENDTVYSSEALADPYNEFMTLEQGFLSYPLLAGVITDTHFGARDRMGRLAGFVARVMQDGLHSAPVGVGIDEATALLVTSDGNGTVIGNGAVYVLTAASAPGQCQSGLPLTFENLSYRVLKAGDVLSLPSANTSSQEKVLSISEGVMTPASPYE
jgi:cyanophycinase